MALVIGTTAGFVSATPPSANPAGSQPDSGDEGYTQGSYFTSPVGSNQVIGFGAYLDACGSTANVSWQIGIYNDTGTNRPINRKAWISGVTAGVTTGMWISGTLATPYKLTASTKYWLLLALGSSPTINIDGQGNVTYSCYGNGTTLSDPFDYVGETGYSIFMAIYALYSPLPPSPSINYGFNY